MGTNSSGSELHSDMDRTVIMTGAADLSPVLATFFSINLVASQLSIEHDLKGFNLSCTSPLTAGLEAVQLGSAAIARGRSQWLLAGATEAVLDAAEPGAAQSEEGAAVLVLEPWSRIAARGGRAWGRCRVRSGFLPPGLAGSERARGLVAGLLSQLRCDASDLPVTAVVADSLVAESIVESLGRAVDLASARAGCLEPMLRLTGLLSDGPDRSLLVVAGGEGNVAFAVVDRAASRTMS